MATTQERTELSEHGLSPTGRLHWNLPPAELIEHAVWRGEGRLSADGSFVAVTEPHTGRSPNDKFTVRESSSEAEIAWGKVNVPMEPHHFEALRSDVIKYLDQQDDLYVRDVWAGADPQYRLSVRVVTPSAWHSVFVHNMFLEPHGEHRSRFEAGFTVLHAPEYRADPETHGTRSGAFVVVNFAERQVLIGGTRYAGEIKKSIFSVMNYLLPKHDVLSMHCSANMGDDGDVALFFGLSGTGKTTLSTDPDRRLIGDDEHGWSEDGVFNFEGGNYAKVIRLSEEGEPLIWKASRQFGAILENVILAEDRSPAFDDDTITENTRSSYPLSHVSGAVRDKRGGHPRNVIFLTADAFGVLPPIARLDRDQAAYHFLSGYTAKVAGTEKGVTEPRATFSACFGEPFLPLPPGRYAELLAELVQRYDVSTWLVNTGWTGGPYGEGHRVALRHTRRMVTAALTGELEDARYHEDPVFGLEVPDHVRGVPDEVLRPRQTWEQPSDYDDQAQALAEMFRENFEKFASGVSESVRAAGP
ncbi:MAG: phosphoenolpyruvate carboxykinase (ATP) [Longimicrobiales bacterium]|nr:phosphoenolpyruvate carboxykinase (ATP) [Longimicrobiales bacterium]